MKINLWCNSKSICFVLEMFLNLADFAVLLNNENFKKEKNYFTIKTIPKFSKKDYRFLFCNEEESIETQSRNNIFQKPSYKPSSNHQTKNEKTKFDNSFIFYEKELMHLLWVAKEEVVRTCKVRSFYYFYP